MTIISSIFQIANTKPQFQLLTIRLGNKEGTLNKTIILSKQNKIRFYLLSHRLWSWNFSVNLLISSLEREIWFRWEREGCWWESEREVLPIRTKKEERRIEKQKNDYSAATKRLGRKFWVGHLFAKGKVSWWLTYKLFKIYFPPPLINLYSRKAQTLK